MGLKIIEPTKEDKIKKIPIKKPKQKQSTKKNKKPKKNALNLKENKRKDNKKKSDNDNKDMKNLSEFKTLKVKKKKEKEQSSQMTENNNDNSIKKNKTIEIMGITDKYIQKLLKQKDFEINSLEYEEAKKLDNRNIFQYYISVIKNNHPLLFSFAPFIDYNSKIIKIFLFFFAFCSDFIINALFYTDETMHKIYQDKGKYDLLYQIPQILHSSFLSRLIDTLIKKLALSQYNIVYLKQEKDINNLDDKYVEKLIRTLKIKFIFFFIVSFLLLLFYWYYIVCFCGIYVNTQIHIIKDSISSLISSFIEPFGIYLIPVIFRIISLRIKKVNLSFFYCISSFLENYL